MFPKDIPLSGGVEEAPDEDFVLKINVFGPAPWAPRKLHYSRSAVKPGSISTKSISSTNLKDQQQQQQAHALLYLMTFFICVLVPPSPRGVRGECPDCDPTEAGVSGRIRVEFFKCSLSC